MPGRAVVCEEREVDGNQKALPLLVVHEEAAQLAGIARDAAEALACVAFEEDGAGVAGAGDAALVEFQQMLVRGLQRLGAEFAHLARLLARCANESAQRGQRSLRDVAGGGAHRGLGRRQVGHSGIDRRALFGVDAGGVACGASGALASRLFASFKGPLFSPLGSGQVCAEVRRRILHIVFPP